MTQFISSMHNPHIQQIRALLNQKSARIEAGLFVVEGVRLAEEALTGGCNPVQAFYSQSANERGMNQLETLINRGIEVIELSTPVMEGLSDTETSQGILLVLKQSETTLPPATDFALVLDQIRDPGNLGTILRSAAAAGGSP